ncbi:MAG: hypothetical protein ACOH2D_09435 [Gelidibacter sp.]|uniref:hypothetical protein n=1 Tax=Gelidibacter sp. TaxID=2018083 RepID=UPI0032660214
MKKSHLHNIKESGFKTPDEYFAAFDQRLFKKIEVQKELAPISNSGYKVPDNYFENFDDKLQKRLKDDASPKVIKMGSWRNAAYISGIAASLILLLTVFTKSQNDVSINKIETASIEEYLNGQNLNIYDIASFLNDEDLVLDNFVTNTFTDESLENYLLDNASIEDLIIRK